MAEYHVTLWSRAADGTFWPSPLPVGGMRRRWDAAVMLAQRAVDEMTTAQALRDREAGWAAYRAAMGLFHVPAPARDSKYAEKIVIGAYVVMLSRVA